MRAEGGLDLVRRALRQRARALDRSTAIGLLGAVLLLAGAAGYLALVSPPYNTDEPAHVGYAVSLRHGQIPDLDSPVPTDGSPVRTAAMNRGGEYFRPNIHVARNPPHPYLASIPLAEVGRLVDVRDPDLFGMRALDILGAVTAVLVTFLLGRELGGGDAFVGVVAAGGIAAVSSLAVLSARAEIDGPALAATTGVTWAVARFARRPGRGGALLVGVWCAAAASVRPMSLAYALVAGALAAAIGLRAMGWRSALPLGLRLGGPAVAITGWFWVVNLLRYGDPTASMGVYELHDRTPGPGIGELLTGPRPSIEPFGYLLTDVYDRTPWALSGTQPKDHLVAAAAVALIAASIAITARRARAARARGDAVKTAPTAWARDGVGGGADRVDRSTRLERGRAAPPVPAPARSRRGVRRLVRAVPGRPLGRHLRPGGRERGQPAPAAGRHRYLRGSVRAPRPDVTARGITSGPRGGPGGRRGRGRHPAGGPGDPGVDPAGRSRHRWRCS